MLLCESLFTFFDRLYYMLLDLIFSVFKPLADCDIFVPLLLRLYAHIVISKKLTKLFQVVLFTFHWFARNRFYTSCTRFGPLICTYLFLFV